jgi:hypothetical protein
MGTNYYLESHACPHCGHVKEKIHIGKSSHGWMFDLHIYPGGARRQHSDDEDNEDLLVIRELDDWERLFRSPQWIIKDEYGAVVPLDELLERITNRAGTTTSKSYVPCGTEVGINNLWYLACDPLGARGTYVLVTGEFS